MKGGSYFMRAELLSPLSTGGADGAGDRHFDVSSRLSPHRSAVIRRNLK